jgi:hypothetical protein
MTYDQTLIVVRERSFLELLDLALVVVRDRPVVLGLAALAGVAPFAALDIWLLSDPEFPRLVFFLLLLVEAPWATAPLTLVLGDLMFGVRPQIGVILQRLALSLPALLVTQLVCRGLLLLTGVGYLLVPLQFSFLSEVVLLERLGPFRSVIRSRSLNRGFEGELFMRWMGQIIVGLIFAVCFRMGAETVGSVLAGSELTWDRPGLGDRGGLLFQTGVWIAIAFFGIVRFLAYIDRRIRLEGWEIELRLRRVGHALEERPQ